VKDIGISTAEVIELARRLQVALGDEYVVERPLGAGGFAVVFLVRDVQLKRHLAVKVLSHDLGTSKHVIERFRREAETVAQLSHPNIVPLHFVGQRDDLLYLVMQCVDGGSLADRIQKEGALPIDDVMRSVAEIASALAHAHKHGVIHRDVKPQNVLLDAETGRCLVTDFGIARTANSASLTATGVMMGTPLYLSPEQLSGEPSDHRVDIYALGIVTYEMLVGKPPFDGLNATAVLMKRLGGPPGPVTKLRPETPRVLVDVIDGCLASDPAERFQSAVDITRIVTGQGPTPVATSAVPLAVKKRHRRRRNVALGVTTALAATGVALVMYMRSGSDQARASARTVSRQTSAAVDEGMALIPAGEYLIGTNTGDSNARPQHVVHLAPFGLDRREVTVGQYKTFIDSTKAPTPWRGAMPVTSLPVTRVLWSEADNYCRWAHRNGGRLPMEEEWEATARGQRGRAYPWGEQYDATAANTQASGRNALVPVATFSRGATPDSVYDLIGNVWEWTSAEMQAYPGAPALPDSMKQFRVIRGGAFNTPAVVATVWFRGYNRPSTTPDDLEYTGFRCAMSARTLSSR
jgi:formylglycine-generating enzyme required for sulfatase activity